jgi:uncharacterized protein
MRHPAALLLTFVLWGAAAAADFSTLQPQGFVSDFSRVLNPAHKQELERYSKRVQELTGAEMALVTLPTLEGEPIEDVANGLFRRWGIGAKGKNEGVLLLLVTGDRRMRLEVGYGLEGILPDGYSGRLLREMRPLLRQQQFGPSLLEAAHQIGNRIALEKNVSLDVTIPSRRPVQHGVDVRAWMAFVWPALLLLFILWTRVHSRRFGPRHGVGSWWILPMLLGGAGRGGGWSGGSSHGGFGGYDSSDSFGGFGGGDSGGGGASSDW